jgi:hypothetical protein
MVKKNIRLLMPVLVLIIIAVIVGCFTFSTIAAPSYDTLKREAVSRITSIDPNQTDHFLSNDSIQTIMYNIHKEFKLGYSGSDYSKARFKAVFNEQNNIDHIVLYALDKKEYKFDIYKLDVDNQLGITNITKDYTETEADVNQFERSEVTTYDDGSYNAVFGTPITEYPSSTQGIQNALKTAAANGFNAKFLSPSESTKANYLYWLKQPNIQVFGSIGHGNKTCILCKDTTLSYTALKSIKLSEKVLYLNSCLVQNPPFSTTIENDGIEKFIGGKKSLLVGPSEKVFARFWELTLPGKNSMTSSLPQAVTDTKYTDKAAHKISGGGYDLIPSSKSSGSSSDSSSSGESGSSGGSGGSGSSINIADIIKKIIGGHGNYNGGE